LTAAVKSEDQQVTILWNSVSAQVFLDKYVF
jgi:hypothetical protein